VVCSEDAIFKKHIQEESSSAEEETPDQVDEDFEMRDGAESEREQDRAVMANFANEVRSFNIIWWYFLTKPSRSLSL